MIYAVRNDVNYPKDTLFSGKNLLFVDYSDVDAKWNIIRTATIDGLLGNSSKVSTKYQRKQMNTRSHVICVYNKLYQFITV